MTRKYTVAWIKRRKNSQSFSLEKVFSSVFPLLYKDFNIQQIEVKYRTTNPLTILLNLVSLVGTKASLNHITGDVHYAVFAFRRESVLLTIHDCVFLEQSRGLKRILFKWLWLKWPVKYAKHITTISEKSKDEIIFHTGCKADKITVIPDPVGSSIQAHPYRFNSEYPKILFIGTKPNKNLLRSIDALKGLNCHLNIVGRLNPEQLEKLNEAGINYTEEWNLSDEEMAQRYITSDFVLFPSTYEGFGLPVIEAQKAGRPIITSCIRPMTDIAAGAACFVDPFDVDSIKEGILKICNDTAFRNSLIMNGKLNAEKYSDKNVARMYKELYNSLIQPTL